MSSSSLLVSPDEHSVAAVEEEEESFDTTTTTSSRARFHFFDDGHGVSSTERGSIGNDVAKDEYFHHDNINDDEEEGIISSDDDELNKTGSTSYGWQHVQDQLEDSSSADSSYGYYDADNDDPNTSNDTSRTASHNISSSSHNNTTSLLNTYKSSVSSQDVERELKMAFMDLTPQEEQKLVGMLLMRNDSESSSDGKCHHSRSSLGGIHGFERLDSSHEGNDGDNNGNNIGGSTNKRLNGVGLFASPSMIAPPPHSPRKKSQGGMTPRELYVSPHNLLVGSSPRNKRVSPRKMKRDLRILSSSSGGRPYQQQQRQQQQYHQTQQQRIPHQQQHHVGGEPKPSPHPQYPEGSGGIRTPSFQFGSPSNAKERKQKQHRWTSSPRIVRRQNNSNSRGAPGYYSGGRVVGSASSMRDDNTGLFNKSNTSSPSKRRRHDDPLEYAQQLLMQDELEMEMMQRHQHRQQQMSQPKLFQESPQNQEPRHSANLIETPSRQSSQNIDELPFTPDNPNNEQVLSAFRSVQSTLDAALHDITTLASRSAQRTQRLEEEGEAMTPDSVGVGHSYNKTTHQLYSVSPGLEANPLFRMSTLEEETFSPSFLLGSRGSDVPSVDLRPRSSTTMVMNTEYDAENDVYHSDEGERSPRTCEGDDTSDYVVHDIAEEVMAAEMELLHESLFDESLEAFAVGISEDETFEPYEVPRPSPLPARPLRPDDEQMEVKHDPQDRQAIGHSSKEYHHLPPKSPAPSGGSESVFCRLYHDAEDRKHQCGNECAKCPPKSNQSTCLSMENEDMSPSSPQRYQQQHFGHSYSHFDHSSPPKSPSAASRRMEFDAKLRARMKRDREKKNPGTPVLSFRGSNHDDKTRHSEVKQSDPESIDETAEDLLSLCVDGQSLAEAETAERSPLINEDTLSDALDLVADGLDYPHTIYNEDYDAVAAAETDERHDFEDIERRCAALSFSRGNANLYDEDYDAVAVAESHESHDFEDTERLCAKLSFSENKSNSFSPVTRRMKQQQRGIVLLQSHIRGFVVRSRHFLYHTAATFIQKCFRMYRSKSIQWSKVDRRLLRPELFNSVQKFQEILAFYEDANNTSQLESSSLASVQKDNYLEYYDSLMNMLNSKIREINMRNLHNSASDAVRIQRSIRLFHQQQEYQRVHGSLALLQASIRKRQSKKTLDSSIDRYHKMHNGFIELQALTRGWLARNRAAGIRVNAEEQNCQIQQYYKIYRGFVALQSRVRGSQVRWKLVTHVPALKVQSFARMVIQKHRYHMCIASATLLQSRARIMLARKAYNLHALVASQEARSEETEVAATLLQCTWRAFHSRVITAQSMLLSWKMDCTYDSTHINSQISLLRAGILVLASALKDEGLSKNVASVIGNDQFVDVGWRREMNVDLSNALGVKAGTRVSQVTLLVKFRRRNTLKALCSQEHFIRATLLCALRRELTSLEAKSIALIQTFIQDSVAKTRHQQCLKIAKEEGEERLERLEKCALVVQRCWRSRACAFSSGKCANTCSFGPALFGRLYQSCLLLQSIFRGMLVRSHLRKLSSKALLIQRVWSQYNKSGSIVRPYANGYTSILVIQRTWRKKYQVKKDGVATMEHRLQCEPVASVLPEHIVEEVLNAKDHDTAALLVQSYARAFIHHRRYVIITSSAVRIQTLHRSLSQKLQYARCRSGIIALQAKVRGEKSRFEYFAMFAAVIKIQSVIRGDRARRAYILMKLSALKVQMRFRSYCQKQRYTIIRVGFICLQSRLRGARCRAAYARIIDSVMKLQSVARSVIFRRRIIRSLGGVTRTQAHARGLIAKMALLPIDTYAILYQTPVLEPSGEVDTSNQDDFVVKAQAIIRGYFSRSQFIILKGGIVSMQARVRGRQARLSFATNRDAVVTLQSLIRGKIQRRGYVTVQSACVTVQSSWRGFVQRSRYRKLQVGVVALQSIVRGVQCKITYASIIDTVVKLQSLARRTTYSNQYHRLQLGVRRMQASVRGVQARSSLDRIQQAVLFLQSQARANVIRSQYLRIQQELKSCNSSARKIQRAWFRYTSQCTKKPSFEKQQQRLGVALVFVQRKCALRSSTDKHHIENEAATKLQAFFRSRIIRLQLLTLTRNAIKIQGCYRHYWITVSIKTSNEMRLKYTAKLRLRREVAAITKLQSSIRAWSCRKELAFASENTTKIQRFYRRFSSMNEAKTIQLKSAYENELRRKNRELAASKLQAVFRSWRCQRELACEKDLFVAINLVGKSKFPIADVGADIKISSSPEFVSDTTPSMAVKPLSISLSPMVMNLQNDHFDGLSAQRIQKIFRGWSCRNDLSNNALSAIKIQCCYRKHCATRLDENASFLRVQSSVVGIVYQQRRRVDAKILSAVQIQKIARGWKGRREYSIMSTSALLVTQSAVAVQSVVRKFLVRSNYTKLHYHAAIIQKRWSIHLHKSKKLSAQKYMDHSRSILTIQRLFRSRRTMPSVSSTVRHTQWLACILQAHWRGASVRQQMALFNSASAVIQRSCAQSKLSPLVSANEYHRYLTSVVTIQSIVRMNIVLEDMRRWQSSSALIQCIFRGHRSRSQQHRVYQSAVTLQRFMKNWAVGKSNQLQHLQDHGSVTIQSVLRGALARSRRNELSSKAAIIQRAWMVYSSQIASSTNHTTLYRNHRAILRMQEVIKDRFARRTQAAKKIQLAFFTWNMKRSLATVQSAVRQLQRVTRGHLVRRRFGRTSQSRGSKTKLVISESGRNIVATAALSSREKSTPTLEVNVTTSQAGAELESTLVAGSSNALLDTSHADIALDESIDTSKQSVQYLQSIVLVQSFARRHLAKRQVSLYAAEKKSRLDEVEKSLRVQTEDAAASKIQSRLRSLVCKRGLDNSINAAIQIQQWHRRVQYSVREEEANARLKELSLRNEEATATKLQSIVRRWRCKNDLKARMLTYKDSQLAKNMNSAVVIQKTFRGWRVRSPLLKFNASALTLQRAYRLYAMSLTSKTIQFGLLCSSQSALCNALLLLARKKEKAIPTERSAVRIQSLSRRQLAIVRVEEARTSCLLKQKQDVYAKKAVVARSLQRLFRLAKAKEQEEKIIAGELENSKAIVIQAAVRGCLLRAPLHRANKAARIIQRAWRTCVTSLRSKLLKVSQVLSTPVNMPTTYSPSKMKRARALLPRDPRGLNRIRDITPQLPRDHECGEFVELVLNSVTVVIQSSARQFIVRQRYQRSREAACCIQRAWRQRPLPQMVLADLVDINHEPDGGEREASLQRSHEAECILRIQSIVRMKLARKSLKQLVLEKADADARQRVECAVRIQSISRMKLANNAVSTWHTSATILQQLVRRLQAANVAKRLVIEQTVASERYRVECAVRIQSIIRMKLVKRVLSTQHYSATTIQRFIRGIQANEVARRLVAAKVASDALERRRVDCALCIQSIVRMKLVCKEQRQQTASAAAIQRFVRRKQSESKAVVDNQASPRSARTKSTSTITIDNNEQTSPSTSTTVPSIRYSTDEENEYFLEQMYQNAEANVLVDGTEFESVCVSQYAKRLIVATEQESRL